MQVEDVDIPGSVARRSDAAWWDFAACVGHDPEWWSDDGEMLAAALRICLDCPVRRPCLDEALRNGDFGVIRAGMLIARTKRGPLAVPLLCAECCTRPVRGKWRGQERYCSPRCRAAAGARTFNYAAQLSPTPLTYESRGAPG